jgi:hypothetical protein
MPRIFSLESLYDALLRELHILIGVKRLNAKDFSIGAHVYILLKNI